ncbi:MAG TPA: hypothetical protein VF607_03070 [Verrucomicrobiae bacterium]
MNLKRWFAWACLVLVLVAECALFRAYRDQEALRTDLRATQTQLRQVTAERDELQSGVAGERSKEIIRLRKQYAVLTNQYSIWRAALYQLSQQSASNAEHLATARLALRLQQEHLSELQDQNQQIAETSLDVIARKTCINNLRLIDDAKQAWAKDFSKGDNAIPTAKDLLPYLPDNVLPECPGGGIYSLNAVNEVPTCSSPNHLLPR